MDTMSMLQIAVILFAVAAAGGLVMAGIRFMSNGNPPAWLTMLHGLLAAAGLTLALYAAYTTPVPTLGRIGVGVLMVAAAGGAFLNLFYQQKQKLLPASIVVLHAGLAVVGFGCLVVAAFLS